jgi:hypothetical protein
MKNLASVMVLDLSVWQTPKKWQEDGGRKMISADFPAPIFLPSFSLVTHKRHTTAELA